MKREPGTDIRLGLGPNFAQFSLLVLVNAFVGGVVGLERVIVPLMAESEFGLVSSAAILSFLISFGVVKAAANLVAGRAADRWGRRRVLIVGWLFGVPIPFLLMFAPTWEWVVFANVLLGVNQGLCWSATVIMKIDLVGPKRRGLAMGLNEFAGYISVSIAAFATGFLASSYGLRPVPFFPGVLFVILGFGISLLFVRETKGHARTEAQLVSADSKPATELSFAEVFRITSWKNRTLFAACQAGMVNNLNDGVMWGLLPIILTGAGLSIEGTAFIAALYPGVWGAGQLVTGALSDRVGRKWLIASGMWVQAAGISFIAFGTVYYAWVVGAILLGIGTALVYPTLLSSVSDVAEPAWRASSIGVYRLWRDAGFAVGGLSAGLLADAFNISGAVAIIGALTFASGVLVAFSMKETLPRVPSLSQRENRV